MDQYRGLAQLPDPSTRMNVLANITESAAFSGDAAAVKRFLKDFEKDPRHDDLAARCAGHLSAQNGEDAVMVANLIEDKQRRTSVLADVSPKKEEPKAKDLGQAAADLPKP